MKKIRIAIIGSGIAGLVTAYDLSEDPTMLVTVIEAMPYPGGRIQTFRASSKIYAEKGGLTICDSDNRTLELVEALELKLEDRSSRSAKKYQSADGQCIPWISSQPNEYFKKYILNNIPKSIHDFHSLECAELDEISMIDFIKKSVSENNKKSIVKDDVDKVLHGIQVSILGLYCDNFSKLSALSGLRWLSQYINARKSFSIKGGNDLLPLALVKSSEAKGVHFLYKTAVLKIKRPCNNSDFSPVVLTVVNANKKEFLEFDYVILTVPLSALQKMEANHVAENFIEFDPPLPHDQQTAIDNIQQNRSMARVYFEFKNRFWLKFGQSTAMTISQTPTIWIEDHTDYLDSHSPAILEVHASGNAGKMFQMKDPIELAMQELEKIWGNEVKKNLSSTKPIVHFWSEEFYQKAAYPYLGVRQDHYRFLISRPLPSLLFAGEYTEHIYSASIEGAVKSAKRVIHDLKSMLSIRQVNTPSKRTYPFWTTSGDKSDKNTLGVISANKIMSKL